ncbi:MAG: TRAP transporter small permease [Spirochaetales bacterium]|jgi:TRAP-type C4-dicarboxylate transport system permease small subunit|nr:TRAP transporter small permease [Spirochaetales bacterium]
MKKKLEYVQKILDKALNVLATILFFGIFFVVLLQVVMRYCLNLPLAWSEELARYLFIWISFIGWVFATRSGTHIRIGAIVDNLPGPAKKAIGSLNYLLTIIFACVMTYYGFIMLQKNLDVPTVTLFFTYAVVYVAAPFSSVLIIFYTLSKFITGMQDMGGTLS